MSWEHYKSHINKKVFFEILDNSFNNKKELVIETYQKQRATLLELQRHIASFSPKETNYWNYKFQILTNSLSNDRNITGRAVLEYYRIFDDYTMQNYLIARTQASSHTQQELYMVVFFKDNILNIEFPIHKYAYNGKKLEDVIVRFDKYKTTKHEIVQFVDALMAKQKELEHEMENTKLKKQKVTILKSKTIIAKVKAIMKEKDMMYRFEEKHNKIILIIKLSQSQVIEITITYKKFQTTLQNLSELVDKLVELYEQGIEVKHKQTNKTNHYTWIDNK